MKTIAKLMFIFTFSHSLDVSAWVLSEKASVNEIIEWQDNAPVYFKLSTGIMCFIPASEKNMYSLILSMYAARKKADVHCHDAAESYGGMTGHRVHRVISR